MRLVPGLIIGQHHGGGKADQILFRGFDSDHGTDFQVSIDGIPVNMPSHAHGQGYADLHWLIPETIDRVEIFKGSYFPHLGDFATSGAINIVTRRYAQQSSATVMGGSYQTARFLGILSAPEGTTLRPYTAFEYYHSDGPFKNPGEYNRYNFFSNFNIISNARSTLDFLATYFSSNWNASGEIPSRAVRDRTLGRFGAVDSSEGGNTERQNLSLIYNFADANQSLRAQTWMSWYRFQLWSNFSYFLNNPVEGDGIEQNDKRYLVGNNVIYRRNYFFGDIPTETLAWLSEPVRSHHRRPLQPGKAPPAEHHQRQRHSDNQPGLVCAPGNPTDQLVSGSARGSTRQLLVGCDTGRTRHPTHRRRRLRVHRQSKIELDFYSIPGQPIRAKNELVFEPRRRLPQQRCPGNSSGSNQAAGPFLGRRARAKNSADGKNGIQRRLLAILPVKRIGLRRRRGNFRAPRGQQAPWHWKPNFATISCPG